MSRFTLKCMNPITGSETELFYDTSNSSLTYSDGTSVIKQKSVQRVDATVVSKNKPGKKSTPSVLKISLGLSCNYECSYCSQRFVPHADSTNPSDVPKFVDGLDDWVKSPPARVEFWGGEPFVYWKTLKPLAEAIRVKFPSSQLSLITNGSLLDSEKNEWLDTMGFVVGISHDGPGYKARGIDPLTVPEQREAIHDLWKRLGPQGRMSFNAVFHKDNPSRSAVQEFMVTEFGPSVPIGEGAFIDPYDAGGVESSFTSAREHLEFRNNALVEIRDGKIFNFNVLEGRVRDFVKSVETSRSASSLGQKCAMDRADNIAVDLNGNVLTCQNVSAAATSPNGESHKIGHVSDFGGIAMKTSTHWSERDECSKCPVLQLCKGSCMFLDGPLWDVGCNNSYSDAIPFFAAAIEMMTGYLPYYIDGPLREDRKDIFGLVNGVPEDKKKPFPIPVVSA